MKWYDRMDFDYPVGVEGDSYDRYLVRVERCATNQHHPQCITWLRDNPGPVMNAEP